MPMYNKEFGTATRLVATGLSTLSSANACILGVLFNGTATGGIKLYHGVTASGSVASIRAYQTTAATMQSAVYYPCPAYASGGLTVDVDGSQDPDITLFWSPV